MSRLFLILLLFLLPFLVFGGWRWLITGARGHRAIMSDAPVLILIGAGIMLVGAGLFLFASHDKPGIEGRWHPPVYKDGKIQPGYFEKSQFEKPQKEERRDKPPR